MELNATILIQGIILLALFAWLTPVLFSPLMKVFDERDRRIHGATHEAQAYLGAADQKTAVVEQKTKEAQAQARLILADLRDKATTAETVVLVEAREKAALRLDEARSDLFEASEATRLKLKADANAIADEIVKKILGRAV